MVRIFFLMLVFYAIIALGLVLLTIVGFVFSTVSGRDVLRNFLVAVLFPIFLLHSKGRAILVKIIQSYN